jgi:hypothetical protein
MIKKVPALLLLVICHLSLSICFAQDDIMNLLDQNEKPKNEPVLESFKTTRVINAQSTETVPKNAMDLRITHRFGNIGAASGGGYSSFYGMDNVANIRIAFEYGILENWMVGVGRSKTMGNIDAFTKWRFLTQTTNNKVPLSLAVYLNAAISPIKREIFYADVPVFKNNILHRLSYTAQLIIARKFGNVGSLELLPTYVHRNYVKTYINPENGAGETNGLFALGAAARIKLTKRSSILVEYFYTFSEFRKNNPTRPYYQPISIGYEIETGGHVFHMNFSNAVGIIENDFVVNSPDTWNLGGFKWGFNISRVFNF